jgi:hypothetical protein
MHTVQHLLSQISDGTWQDLTLSAGNIFFCITLIPMLRQPGRPPLLTCIPTGLALVAGGFVFASLHLWLTALTQTIAGLQWLALVFKSPPKAASSLSETEATRQPNETILALGSRGPFGGPARRPPPHCGSSLAPRMAEAAIRLD